MQKLGKFKTGKSCLYVKRLADVDMKVRSAPSARTARANPAPSVVREAIARGV